MNIAANLQTHVSVRFLVVGVIGLGLMIPLIMVSGLSDERESYYHEAITSIATAWGTEQTLTGPFLVVPYAPTHKTTPPNWQVPEHKLRRQVVLIPDDIHKCNNA